MNFYFSCVSTFLKRSPLFCLHQAWAPSVVSVVKYLRWHCYWQYCKRRCGAVKCWRCRNGGGAVLSIQQYSNRRSRGRGRILVSEELLVGVQHRAGLCDQQKWRDEPSHKYRHRCVSIAAWGDDCYAEVWSLLWWRTRPSEEAVRWGMWR